MKYQPLFGWLFTLNELMISDQSSGEISLLIGTSINLVDKNSVNLD